MFPSAAASPVCPGAPRPAFYGLAPPLRSASNSPPLALATHAAVMTRILQEEDRRIELERQYLAGERAALEAMKTKVSSVHHIDRVKLNVGGQVRVLIFDRYSSHTAIWLTEGQIFTTSRDTLLREEGSMFHVMFSGSHIKLEKGEDDAYFIDRDGTHFRHILNYLRTAKAYIPVDSIEVAELLDELDFYHIRSYARVLRDETEGKLEFAFARFGDANGILYWLGCGGHRHESWRNPVASGVVKTAFLNGGLLGGVSAFADRGLVLHEYGLYEDNHTDTNLHSTHSFRCGVCLHGGDSTGAANDSLSAFVPIPNASPVRRNFPSCAEFQLELPWKVRTQATIADL